MFKHRGLSLVVAVFCGTVAAAQSPSLPADAAQAKVTTACMECHEARIILQQRLSKVTWAKEVDKMVKWGAVVDPADRDSFVDYLSANFPTEKPAEPAARTAAEKKKIVYDAVWSDESDPSKTYQNAAQALLTELRKRSGINMVLFREAFEPNHARDEDHTSFTLSTDPLPLPGAASSMSVAHH